MKDNHAECVSALLSHKDIEVNRMYDGLTVLHITAMNGKLECLQLLLNHKDINVNIQASSVSDKSRPIPLHYAVCNMVSK